MQLTSDQYLALIVIAISTVIFGAINYWCGRLDRARLRAHWKLQYEQQLKANELQWQAIARNRNNAEALRAQLGELTEALADMESKALTAGQRRSIEQAAHQLELNAQLMTAIKNDANAQTLRRLAADLRTVSPVDLQDAAA